MYLYLNKETLFLISLNIQLADEYNNVMIYLFVAELKVNLAWKPMSAIIFTKRRFTAKVLYNLLKDVKETNPEEFGFLSHDFVVGFNINPANNTREQHYTKKASQTAFLKFSKK